MKRCGRKATEAVFAAPGAHARPRFRRARPQGSGRQHQSASNGCPPSRSDHISKVGSGIVLGGWQTRRWIAAALRVAWGRGVKVDRPLRLRGDEASPWGRKDAMGEDIPLNMWCRRKWTHPRRQDHRSAVRERKASTDAQRAPPLIHGRADSAFECDAVRGDRTRRKPSRGSRRRRRRVDKWACLS